MRYLNGRFLSMAMVSSMVATAPGVAHDVSGYGSGDSYVEAVVAAKADAVLNERGKADSYAKVSADRLVSDGGQAENTAYLVSYDVTDKGESLEGFYARIVAKVSKAAEYKLKNGRTPVKGSACNKEPEKALIEALSAAVIESGSKVSVFVKHENDILVSDDATFDAYGVIHSASMTKSTDGNNCNVDATCLISEKPSSGTDRQTTAEGGGSTRQRAFRDARRQVILNSGLGMEYFVRAEYKNGERVKLSTTRSRNEVLIDCRLDDSVDSGTGCVTKVTAAFSNPGTDFGPKREAVGYGSGSSLSEAVEAAMKEAVVNVRSDVVMEETFLDGGKTSEQLTYKGSCVVLDSSAVDHSRSGDVYSAKVQATVAGSLPEVPADFSQDVEIVGYGLNKEAAIEDAKQRAVDMFFGCQIDFEMNESDGEVEGTSFRAVHSEKGYVAEFEELSEENVGETKIVKIRATVKNHDGDVDDSWGWILATFVVFILGGIVMAIKEKAGSAVAIIADVISAVLLFWNGHWIVALVVLILGIGAVKSE